MANDTFKFKKVSEVPARAHGGRGSTVIGPIVEHLQANEGAWYIVANRETATAASGVAARLREYEGISAAQRKSDDGESFNVFGGFNVSDAPAKAKRPRKPKAA